MRRFTCCLLVLLILGSMMVSVSAAQAPQTIVTVTDLGDGWTCTEELVVNTFARSQNKDTTRTQIIKDNNGEAIAVVTLYAVFAYDGETAWVTSKSVTRSDTYDGWSYSQTSLTSSGGTVTLNYKLKKLLSTKNCSLSITCDKNGTIS